MRGAKPLPSRALLEVPLVVPPGVVVRRADAADSVAEMPVALVVLADSVERVDSAGPVDSVLVD